jgi:hypothetical protein
MYLSDDEFEPLLNTTQNSNYIYFPTVLSPPKVVPPKVVPPKVVPPKVVPPKVVPPKVVSSERKLYVCDIRSPVCHSVKGHYGAKISISLSYAKINGYKLCGRC